MLSKSTAELIARAQFADMASAQSAEGKTRGRPFLKRATAPLSANVFLDDLNSLDVLAGGEPCDGRNRSTAVRLCFGLAWALIAKHTPPGGSMVEGFIAAHMALNSAEDFT